MSLIAEDPERIKVCFGIVRKAGRQTSSLTGLKKRGDTLSLEEYVREMGWCHNNSFVIARETFLRDGLYNPVLRNREDIELIIRLLCKLEFYYCGAEVGQIRDVCTNRARDNYANILDPANSFAHFIQENPLIRSALSQDTIRYLIAEEVVEQLRALYRMNRYSEYRTLFDLASQQHNIGHWGKFYKRYLLSYIKGVFVTDPMVREANRDLRDTSRFSTLKRRGETLVHDNELAAFCQAQDNLCDHLDQLIADGNCYKSDATSTVASVDHPWGRWVVKRYNHKGFATTMKLMTRKSRAERAFCKGLILMKMGIATPKPLLFAVRYVRGLPYSCYIINEKSDGDTICNLYDSGKITREDWPGIVSKIRELLDKLHNRGITHGDIKPTNILLKGNDIEIIDLDSMRVHWSGRIFDHFYNKDLGALKKRVAGYINNPGKS